MPRTDAIITTLLFGVISGMMLYYNMKESKESAEVDDALEVYMDALDDASGKPTAPMVPSPNISKDSSMRDDSKEIPHLYGPGDPIDEQVSLPEMSSEAEESFEMR